MNNELIKEALLKGNYVAVGDMEKAQVYAEEHRSSFLEYLISEGLTSNDIVGQAMAEHFSVPYTKLAHHELTKEETGLIPEETAKKWRAIVVGRTADEVTVATDNPQISGLEPALAALFPDSHITITYALSDEIDSVLSSYEPGLETRFAQILETKGRVAPEIVDQIIEDALFLKASDIHCEPQEKEVVIRFRIDGVLHEAGHIPREYYETILNRIKVQAKLRIDSHFDSQDGAIRYASKGHSGTVDLRVSVVPTLDGEKVAMRILSSYVRDLTLSDIGLSQELQDQILESVRKPFGMILVTGPTGSGKTTTLYSLIKVLNTTKTNITTIEDPVEYKIHGINQIQVNNQTNLTFARGLRAIARQDPNVILVGEIRDLETADTAVNAALTGHLLLSTFHANNATTAIPRFIDMGVEPFLVGSTVELIISQRLARKVCESCKVSHSVSKAELEKYGEAVSRNFNGRSITLYKGKGCNVCAFTGYKGRIGIFEFIKATPELQDLIVKNPSSRDVFTLAVSQGFKPMFQDGIEKVKSGLTTLEELLRVVAPQ